MLFILNENIKFSLVYKKLLRKFQKFFLINQLKSLHSFFFFFFFFFGNFNLICEQFIKIMLKKDFLYVCVYIYKFTIVTFLTKWGLKVEFSSQRFIELLIKLSIVELLNFGTCSRREGVTLPIL